MNDYLLLILIILYILLALRETNRKLKSNKNIKIIISEKSIDGYMRTGLPWHYAHFIRDFLLPISHYFNDSPVDIIKLETTKQSIGTFKKHFSDLYNVKCLEIDIEKYKCQDKIPEIILYSYSMPNPPKHYPPKYCLPLKKWAYKRYNLIPEHKYILFIKRGIAKLGTEKIRKIATKKQLNTGLERRQIKNQYEISNKLKQLYPDIFKEIELDNMSMQEQIKLFSKCKCLIGVHGAGLFNCVWLPKDSLVIELGNRLILTVEGLTYSSECRYTHIPGQSNEINIDILLKSINN